MDELPRINDMPDRLFTAEGGLTSSDDEPGVVTAADGSRWAVPVCTVCGHGACPCCLTWCDVLLPDGDYDPCCDMACSYTPEDVERFELQQDAPDEPPEWVEAMVTLAELAGVKVERR